MDWTAHTIRAYDALIEKQDERIDHMRERANGLIAACPRDLRRLIEERISDETFEGCGATYTVNANRLLGLLRLALHKD